MQSKWVMGYGGLTHHACVRYKTMNIVVHKDAIPAHIKAKLGMTDSKANTKKGKKK